MESPLTEKPFNEGELLGSPVTTPGSTVDEEKCLVSNSKKCDQYKPVKWNSKKNIPLFALAVSFLEIIFFLTATPDIQKWLRFEPRKRIQIWRFLTYMLIHDNAFHLLLNVLMQCIFAYFLEERQGSFRVGGLYLGGVVTGVLGASCLNTKLVVGSSAGVYALLISLISDLILNFKFIKYKIYRSLCIVIIVVSDAFYNLHHYLSKDEPQISWEAHIFGGIAGLFLGLVFYKNISGSHTILQEVLYWGAFGLYLILLIVLVILSVIVQKCTPSTASRYYYSC